MAKFFIHNRQGNNKQRSINKIITQLTIEFVRISGPTSYIDIFLGIVAAVFILLYRSNSF
jgi:hypothetical protein